MARKDWGYDDFRDLVQMVGADEFLEGGCETGPGLALKELFGAGFDLVPPPINTANWPELYAGGQPCRGDEICQVYGLGFRLNRTGDNNI